MSALGSRIQSRGFIVQGVRPVVRVVFPTAHNRTDPHALSPGQAPEELLLEFSCSIHAQDKTVGPGMVAQSWGPCISSM